MEAVGISALPDDVIVDEGTCDTLGVIHNVIVRYPYILILHLFHYKYQLPVRLNRVELESVVLSPLVRRPSLPKIVVPLSIKVIVPLNLLKSL